MTIILSELEIKIMKSSHVWKRFVFLVFSGLFQLSTGCPATCSCDSSSKRVACRDDALLDIPLAIPSDTMFLSVSGTVGSEFAQPIHLTRGHFAQLKDLSDLHITNSHVSTIDGDSLQDVPLLRRVTISNNKIKNIPKGLFQNLDHLANIDITGNEQCDVEQGVFNNILSLRYLYAGYVNMGSVELDTFQGLPSLLGLHIPGTNLEKIDGGSLTSLTSLKVLDISDNSLTTLPQTLQPRLSKLETIHLAANPWHCNCAMEWLKTISAISLPASATTPLNPDSLVTCLTPSSLRFQHLNAIPRTELPCVAPTTLDCGGNYSFTEGGPLTIRCDVSGDPDPDMRFINPHDVAIDATMSGFRLEGYTLVVPSAAAGEEGEWVVTAENAEGKISTRVQVSMKVVPDPETTTGDERTTARTEQTTVRPQQTTVRPQQTTVRPRQTTVRPQQATVKPQQTTVSPQQTTVQPSVGYFMSGMQSVGHGKVAEVSVDNTGVVVGAVAASVTVIAATFIAVFAIRKRYLKNRVEPFS